MGLTRYPASYGAAAFTDLTDTPSSYSSLGGKQIIVKSTEDGLEDNPGVKIYCQAIEPSNPNVNDIWIKIT